VLAPESSVSKLEATVHAAGSSLHVLDPSLFSSAVPDADAGPSAGSPGPDEQRHASHAGAGGSGREEGSGALIIYTSGTTGRPKGALHTHG
jgi:malonyl-CoA/methylmalonyl-CoA synthetase